MYFWIVGENNSIISEALSYLHITNFSQPRKNIIVFDTQYPERLQYCAVLIKRGTIYSNTELSNLDNIKGDIAVETKELWNHLKKQIATIKRFKISDLIHTDLEIKKSWTEIINIDNINYGIVEGYQNIALYEAIDFGKPVGGMNIGMMPSKLALTLVNIGIGEYENTVIARTEDEAIHSIWKKQDIDCHASLAMTPPLTIWDPFCWFGTTNYLVNALWHNTIASDINVTSMKQNSKRRPTQPFYNQTGKELILKHDVKDEFKSPLLRHADIIVSEWWLGHIVTSRTAPFETNVYAQEVKELYIQFAKNLTELAKSNGKWLTLVITIPVWLKYEISVSDEITQEFTSLWRTSRLVTQPYSREKQLVGRQILIANFQV